ncbi:MAG TPA: signal peptidase I [Opitutaceae bacterium]|nr:signal peptidase I [Opitutaceae bacterium]
MFGLFESNQRKMRENAENWLRLADKVYHYQRDHLTPAQAGALLQKRADLRQLLKQRADASKLKLSIEMLEAVLRPVGGTFYPKSALVENVEFFLVAVIIVLGIRTYFLQPFKIPTNSMWPTFHGMKGENFPPGQPAPGIPERLFRFAAYGAVRHEAIAPRNGQVSAQFFSNGLLAFTVRRGYKWLIVPTVVHEYTFFVDGAPAAVRVPADFSDFDQLVQDTFFGGHDGFVRFIDTSGKEGGVTRDDIQLRDDSGETAPAYRIALGKTVRAGEPIVRFDILTGDQLVVDRLSYHFVRPQVGDGFVFRTRNIPGIGEDQYYVKRLVGQPGDTLEIRPPVLFRNGRPITGAAAFGKNARREGLYRGYFNASRDGSYLFAGEQVTVPPHVFFALGDNSASSKDGRYWGFVPEKEVVGRPLFIYYPFTRRWGPAR